MCISQIKDGNGTKPVYTIYYGNQYLEITDISGTLTITESGNMPVYDCITEYQLNEQRMGVFEPVLSTLNSMNTMTSAQLDLLEEIVNTYS